MPGIDSLIGAINTISQNKKDREDRAMAMLSLQVQQKERKLDRIQRAEEYAYNAMDREFEALGKINQEFNDLNVTSQILEKESNKGLKTEAMQIIGRQYDFVNDAFYERKQNLKETTAAMGALQGMRFSMLTEMNDPDSDYFKQKKMVVENQMSIAKSNRKIAEVEAKYKEEDTMTRIEETRSRTWANLNPTSSNTQERIKEKDFIKNVETDEMNAERERKGQFLLAHRRLKKVLNPKLIPSDYDSDGVTKLGDTLTTISGKADNVEYSMQEAATAVADIFFMSNPTSTDSWKIDTGSLVAEDKALVQQFGGEDSDVGHLIEAIKKARYDKKNEQVTRLEAKLFDEVVENPEYINNLDYKGYEFPLWGEDSSELWTKNVLSEFSKIGNLAIKNDLASDEGRIRILAERQVRGADGGFKISGADQVLINDYKKLYYPELFESDSETGK